MRNDQIPNRHSREGGNPLVFDGRKMDPCSVTKMSGDDAGFVEAVTHFVVLGK
jgi:hypothetical protein